MPLPVSRQKHLAYAEHWERMAKLMVWNEVACARLQQLAGEARAKARTTSDSPEHQHRSQGEV